MYGIFVVMHVEWVPNRGRRPTVLLRETWREGKQVKKRTIANLTEWPLEKIEALRKVLKGEAVVTETGVTVEQSLPHGQVEAIVGMIKKLGLDALLASRPCRERDVVLAMIAGRLIHPSSKLATTRLWHTTTLAEELSVGDADEDELYHALDWLLARQERIEKKLANRHLHEGSFVLYDVTSSYYEGHTCPLVRFGHDRDEKGKPIIVYGALTDHEGRPVALSVYPGNTGDPTTIPDQVEKLKARFGLERLVLVGDRGMLTQTQIEKVKETPGIGWISALRSSAIRDLVEQGQIQMSLFDTRDLGEITSDDYPGERLIACFNPLLCDERKRKRNELLDATEKSLAGIVRTVARRTKTPLGKTEIGKKVGAIMNRFKMAKHFLFTIDDRQFAFTRNEASIAREEALDGIYVIRTSEGAERLSTEDAVRSYKQLAQVERVFRTFKGIELLVRPIWHRTENHVRAHLFLCMLAYYVEWHMRKALAPLLFDDEMLTKTRKTRHPVKPAEASVSAQRKKTRKETPDGLPVHSFPTLMAALGTKCRNRCRIGTGISVTRLTEPTHLQTRALELLGL
jgi:Transposase DDE domain